MMFKEKVFLTCLGFSRNPSDAEDLAQDVYLKAFNKIGTLKDLRLAKIWVLRIAKNTCLDFMKKHRLELLSPNELSQLKTESLNPELQTIQHQQLQFVKQNIQRLPRKQREVFILREYGDLTYQEISQTMKIKKGTVMSRLNRARQTIISQIKGKNEKKQET